MLKKLSNLTIQTELIEKDPKLKTLFDAVDPDVFNTVYKPPYVALVGAIIGQIIRYTDAKRIRGELYKLMNGTDFTIADIEKISDEKFKKIGLDNQKIEILKKTNAFLLKHCIDLSDPNDLVKLLDVKGIGEWTIQTIKLTSMLDVDIFPAKDVFIRKKLQKLYCLSKRPTIKQTTEIAKKWTPYRSVVCWYFWRWF